LKKKIKKTNGGRIRRVKRKVNSKKKMNDKDVNKIHKKYLVKK